MPVDLFKVDNPLALQKAIGELPPDEYLTYMPAGGNQVCVFTVKNQVVYYCDLDCRPASRAIHDALVGAGFDPDHGIKNVNASQRDADLEGGQVPTNEPVSHDEAITRLQKFSMAQPAPASVVTASANTRWSRMASTLFGKKPISQQSDVPKNSLFNRKH